MEVLQNYIPTSKVQLIQFAMWMNNGDVQKAQEFFDFYAKNLDLPDFDPVQPSMMQQVKDGVIGLYDWIKNNQGDIVQGYQFIQSIIKNKGMIPVAEATGTMAEALPPINEE